MLAGAIRRPPPGEKTLGAGAGDFLAILIFAWRKPRFHYAGGHPLPGLTAVLDHPIVQIIARALVLATYAWAGLAMMAGQDLLTNPIFGFLLVWMGSA